MRVTASVNLILIHFITLITFCKRHKVRSPAFCNFLLSLSLSMSKTISSAHYTKVSSILTTQHLQEAYLACLFVKRKALSSFILLAAIAYYSHLLPGIRRVSNTALIFLGDICRMCVYANSEHNGTSDHKSTDLQELVLRATLCVPLWVFVRVFRP